jgi:ADP-ribosyl-[dinitrogen reductase] hydrolase
VAHTEITLSRIGLACGREPQAAEQGAAARASVEAMGYGLLRYLYPGVAYGLGDRIAGSLTAYACGDALGVPWEGQPAGDAATAAEIERLPARKGWPRGATSDDMALTLLVARHLAERDGAGDARAFLADLAEQAPLIRGLGPSTMAAIEGFRRNGELPSSGGATNGAAMRALPVGWIIPHAQEERRRLLAIEMSRATHADPSAHVAACVMAACASWAVEGAGPRLLLEVAIEEARDAAEAAGTGAGLAEILTGLSGGKWRVPAAGISLEPYETVAAVLSCVVSTPVLRDALVQAVQLRGDTDTVAALVGGLFGGRLTPDEVRAELPWHRAVLLSGIDSQITDVSAALATTRAVLSG